MDVIYRGSDPYVEIDLEFDASLLDVFFLTFKQADDVVLEKPLTAATPNGEFIIFKLSQEDTLALTAGTRVKFQGRGNAGGK